MRLDLLVHSLTRSFFRRSVYNCKPVDHTQKRIVSEQRAIARESRLSASTDLVFVRWSYDCGKLDVFRGATTASHVCSVAASHPTAERPDRLQLPTTHAPLVMERPSKFIGFLSAYNTHSRYECQIGSSTSTSSVHRV